jgi:hypothetical protein
MIRVFKKINIGLKLPSLGFRTNVILLEFFVFIIFSQVYPKIVDAYAYKGMVYDFNFYKFLLAISIYALIVTIGYYIKHVFDYVVWHIYLIYMLVPALINYYSSESRIDLILITLVFLFILLITHGINIKTKIDKLSIKFTNNYYFLIILTFILFLPFIIFYAKYINLWNLFLIDVYKTRMIFREISLVPLNYLINILVKILLPLLIVTSFQRNRKWFAFLFIGMVFYLYLCGAFKSYFAGLIAVLIFYLGNLESKLKLFIGSVIILAVLGFLFDDLFIFLDLGIRRVFFTPVGLSNIYIENFSQNYLYWSHTVIGSIFREYPFDRGLTGYVGSVIIGIEGLNANIGVVIEGFVSAGYFGVIIHSLFLGLLFNFFKNLNISHRYFGIIIIIIFNTINSLIQLLLVTHALLVFIVVALFFLKDSNELDFKDV